jgi:predicted regulator of Ras-like GTPase activity (Roadblock/LC7/MglB family)
VRSEDLARLVEALKPPIAEFVRDSRVRITLLINGSGQVMAQHGFTRSYEVMNVASLAAAAHASARALAELTEAKRWTHMHHAGKERQLFLAPVKTPVAELILVVIFDHDSSLGLVQLFFDKLTRRVAMLPEFQHQLPETTQQQFERDLEAGLYNVMSLDSQSEGS